MKTKIFTLFIAVLASVASLNATIVDGIAYSFNKTDSTAQVIAGGTYSGHIVVPQYVRYKGIPFCVTSIGTGAFANSASLSSIALPNSVATIGDETFKNCVNLDSCVLGKGLTNIGQDAFTGCGSLVTLVTYAATPPIVESGNDIDKDWCILYLPEKNSATYATADWWNEFPTISYTVDDYDTDNLFSDEKELLDVQIGGVDVTLNDTIGIARFDWNVNLSSLQVTFSVSPLATADFTSGSTHNFSTPLYIIVTSEKGNQKRYVLKAKRISENKCGDDVYYKVINNVLYIEGNGAMYDDYTFNTLTFSHVIIGEDVTSISNRAFCNCTGLTSVVIPNSVTKIGYEAFSGCAGLTSINLPNSVVEMDYKVFLGCTNITAPIYNSTIFAFLPSSYTSYNIPEGIKLIAGSAFRGCSNLMRVTMPSSLDSIGSGAFHSCENLDSVVIPNNVVGIGMDAFHFCSSLTTIDISNEVRSIGKKAFAECFNLTSITLPSSLISIGTGIFYQCTKLTNIFVPCGEIERFREMLSNDDRIKPAPLFKVNVNATNGSVSIYITSCDSHSAELTATPNSGYRFVQWSDGNTDNPRTILLTQDTTFTAEFIEFCAIASGTCGDSITWDLSCDSVLTIRGKGDMPNYTSASSYPWYSHRNATKSLIIEKGITSIGTRAFSSYSVLKSVTIGKNVSSIGEYAFSSNKITSVVWNAKNCGSYNDFGSQVMSFTFGDEVEAIPASLCSGMTKLTSIEIPNSVTNIGDRAFQSCKGLTSVAIGNSVTSIGERAFNSCTGLTSVTIPNSVINIGNYAFASCYGLTSVTIGAEIPPIVGNISFDSSLPAIYVPCGTINSYKTEWSKYSSKIQYKPLPISVEPSEYGVFTYPTVCDSLLSVTSNYGYHFVKWNDDNTDNPRVITADDTLTLVAEFAINPTITYLYDGTMGNVNGDTILAHSATGEASFTAIANQGYHFVRWNDGNTDNPRTAHIICDTIFEAIFAPNMYALSISSSSETKGTVSDSNGEYEYMSEVQISANPTQGFAFTQWSDNNTENPRTIQMTKNISLIANFLENTTLQSITIGGKTVFIADTMTCFVADTIDAPSIEVIPFFSSTQVEIAPLITMRCGWKTTITLTALDGTIKEHLLTIIKGGTSTSVRATLTGRNAASKSGVGELYADAAVSVRCGSEAITDEYGITGYKLKTGGNYVAITLSNESFAEGDVLNIYTTNISNSANDVMDGYLHLYTDAGTTPLMNIKEHDVPGLHTAILGSGVNGKKAIYLYRTSNDMNPYVAYMEVVRDNDPRSDSALLFNVTIGKKPIEWNGTVGTIPVLPSNDISSMQVDFALSEYATADVPSGILHDFATPLSITVTAERGNSVTYTLRAQTQKCGDNLYWLLKEDSTLVIEGTGAMYDYANMPVQWDRSAVNSVELPKGMTTIGAQVFSGCGNIKSMTFGADVKTIGEQAFYNCTGMQEIYSYRATPPTAYSNTFDGIEKFECVLHVLSASVDMYKAATGWRDFYYVKTIDAEEVTIPLTKVEIEPHDNNVVVTWPTSDEATSYTLEITKDGVVFCTLIFNANGQLQGIAFAPGKNGTRQAPAAVMTSNGGLRFTVTGLDSGTNYHLTLDAKNELDEVVVSYDVDFETTGQSDIPTGMEETDAETIPCKLLRNGQVYIQCGDKTYTLEGMEVK